jgi:hypothetical protein
LLASSRCAPRQFIPISRSTTHAVCGAHIGRLASRTSHSLAASVPKTALPSPLATAIWLPRAASSYRQLLHDAEGLLKQFLLRRQQLTGISPSDITRIAESFDATTWRVSVLPAEQDALTFLLVSMHWRGSRHPASLFYPKTHPPTALVRWLSRFTARQQVDHGRQILDMLAQEEARVHAFAWTLVEDMLSRAWLQSFPSTHCDKDRLTKRGRPYMSMARSP